MTRLITILALLLMPSLVSAQDNGPINIYFNWHADASATVAPAPSATRFENKELRLEIKGDLNDRLFYRFRQQLNKPMAAGTLDRFSKGTDLMYFGWHANDDLTFIIGKQCQSFGGFEYEMNPMFIYEYSDYLERMSIFHAGVTMAWTPAKGQELVAMVTTSSNDLFSDTYSGPVTAKYSNSPAPFEYILNWNASFWDGRLLSRWGVAAASMAKDAWSRFILGGEKLCFPKFQVYLDFMAAWDDIDRMCYASEDGAAYLPSLGLFEDVIQKSLVSKADWQFMPRWNLWVKGMYEVTSVKDIPQMHNYRTSLAYMGGLEYYPFERQDLRFYLAWIGRHFAFSDASGISARDRNRVELGFMYRLKAR